VFSFGGFILVAVPPCPWGRCRTTWSGDSYQAFQVRHFGSDVLWLRMSITVLRCILGEGDTNPRILCSLSPQSGARARRSAFAPTFALGLGMTS